MPRFPPHPDRRPAIVAGASSGIGAATAIELAAHGFPVALGARRVDKCQEIAEKIQADGGAAVALPLDVTDPESVTDFVCDATEKLGNIEVLVAGPATPISAGCTKPTPRPSSHRSGFT
ncbi:short chain dehydrogenase family protein [Mycobacterium kansasii 824]|nr:short chain dehydrogenase family protein [Mycobacterium kansasii 824]